MNVLRFLIAAVVPFFLLFGCSGVNDSGSVDSLLTEFDNGLNMRVTNVTEPMPGGVEIIFDLPTASNYHLEVMSCTGYLMWETNGTGTGEIQVTWDQKNRDGDPVKPGLYIYELTAGDLMSRKLMHKDR